jgi:hypothetical protein
MTEKKGKSGTIGVKVILTGDEEFLLTLITRCSAAVICPGFG